MKKKILLIAGTALLSAVAIAYATLIAPTYRPKACTYALDLAGLRALAAKLPGDKPSEIRVEDVTGGSFPMAIACPGSSWDKAEFRVYAYQLVFADKTILIDTAMNLEQAKALGMTDGWNAAAWQRVSRGLAQAAATYVTHEHADHMGGAVADERWSGNLRLTTAQLESKVMSRPKMSPAMRAALKPIAVDAYEAVASGVVLIQAPGHTPGSQMVFVSRADGVEVLLTGDTAWLMDNVEREQGPAKLVTLMTGGDRNGQACQLAALDRMRKDNPEVSIMPGHDKARMQALKEKGVFLDGFK